MSLVPQTVPAESTPENDPPEQQDWQVPLTFMRARHILLGEDRETATVHSDSWRVKDRVCSVEKQC